MPVGTRTADVSSSSMPLASLPLERRGACDRSSSANFRRSFATMV